MARPTAAVRSVLSTMRTSQSMEPSVGGAVRMSFCRVGSTQDPLPTARTESDLMQVQSWTALITTTLLSCVQPSTSNCSTLPFRRCLSSHIKRAGDTFVPLSSSSFRHESTSLHAMCSDEHVQATASRSRGEM